MRFIPSAITLWLAVWGCSSAFGHPADSAETQTLDVTQKAPPAAKQPSGAASPTLDAPSLLSQVVAKFSAANEYAFDAEIVVDRKLAGDYPNQILAKATVKVALAPGGKYRVEAQNGENAAYLFVSDGQTRWAYVPILKEYSEEPRVIAKTDDVLDEFLDIQDAVGSIIIEKLSTLTIPVMARLGRTVQSVYRNGAVLTVFSKNDIHEGQHMMYLTVLPSAVSFDRIVWMKASMVENQKILIRSDVRVQNLQIGGPIADSEFRFTPPDDANRTDHLAIPDTLPGKTP